MERLRPDDPETIGRYSLVARLGSGGMGVVFLASAGAQSFALKVVRSSYLDNKNLHARFVREIKTLKKISSPHVAKMYDYAVEADTAWHAVEFVAGPSVKEKVEADGPLDSAEWNDLADQLQRALADIHALGIVHRDIKPANLVLGEAGMKLIDFGIARDDDATSLTVTGSVAGSPAWLSPERLEGIDDDPASDLFSAGAVLTYAATGKSPWGDSETTTVSAVITRIIAGSPDLTGLTDAQRQVVDGLLHPDPRARAWVTPTRFSASGQSEGQKPHGESPIAALPTPLSPALSPGPEPVQGLAAAPAQDGGGAQAARRPVDDAVGFPTIKTLVRAVTTPIIVVASVAVVISVAGVAGWGDGTLGVIVVVSFFAVVVAMALAARATWRFRPQLSIPAVLALTVGMQVALLALGFVLLVLVAFILLSIFS
jgi:hypothetical protein